MTVAYLPNLAVSMDRLVARDRAANIAAENAEKLRGARAALRSPSFFSNDELRAFCVTLMNSDDPEERGMDWLRAKQMIETLNRKEWQVRNCPPPDETRQHTRHLAAMILGGLTVIALVVVRAL